MNMLVKVESCNAENMERFMNSSQKQMDFNV